MKPQSKFIVKGVLVDPISKTMNGAMVEVENGFIKSINYDPSIKGPYIIPAFIDSHVHIESSMLVPSRFAEMAVAHGTVAVVTDPHEVANVAGVDGVRFMVDNAKATPLKFYFGVPSCVPASPIEKSGAVIDADIVEALIAEEDFLYLAEMMNFPGVINKDEDVHRKIASAKQNGKPIDGHAPGVTGENLLKYVNAGISTDHECSTIDEAIEKISLGMKILIREGSAARNFEALIPLIEKYSDRIMLCTDDCHPDYLKDGHINKLVARAKKLGYNFFDILKVACVNPVKHYGLKVGLLQQNDPADFNIVDNIDTLDIKQTFIDGTLVYSGKPVSFCNNQVPAPNFPFRTNFTPENIQAVCQGETMNIIEAIEGELITKWKKEKAPVPVGQLVQADPSTDFLKIVLLDRYENTDPVVAFIRGIGIKKGALAASIAHDSHHILAIGCDDKSIAVALEWLIDNRGGLCYATNENINGIPLPFYGLMTDASGIEITHMYETINNLVCANGTKLKAPYMTMSFMALTVIPELKIYHKGLFDSVNFKHVNLFE